MHVSSNWFQRNLLLQTLVIRHLERKKIQIPFVMAYLLLLQGVAYVERGIEFYKQDKLMIPIIEHRRAEKTGLLDFFDTSRHNQKRERQRVSGSIVEYGNKPL